MASKKIGITGQNGFLGTHFKNYINYNLKNLQIVQFERDFFENEDKMSIFIRSCDIIIHLAGLNRDDTEKIVADTNINLANILSKSLTSNNFKGTLLYSSTLHEDRKTYYGKSKKKGEEILHKAATLNGFSFVSFIIPNIFGPFGKPNYNSFISTFSHKIIAGEKVKIIKNDKIPLIYVETVVKQMLGKRNFKGIDKIYLPNEIIKNVDEILIQLKSFKDQYFKDGIIPRLQNSFDIQLFNTFRSAIDSSIFFPRFLKLHTDKRGFFSETIKTFSQGQMSYSLTLPGITRGNHFHTRKIERFCVIQGEAKIALRRIGSKEKIQFNLSGTKPAYVDMPVWTTHNITNVGKEDLITVFWISEHYNHEDPDVFIEKV